MKKSKYRRPSLKDPIKVKAEFPCVISSELKTPLAAVIGYATLLAEEGSANTRPNRREPRR
jgi:signal transduction histidine kinase